MVLSQTLLQPLAGGCGESQRWRYRERRPEVQGEETRVTGRGDQRYRERRPEVQGEETRGTGRGDQRYRERRLEVKREETRGTGRGDQSYREKRPELQREETIVTGRGDQRYMERRPELQREETRVTERGDQSYREKRPELQREETIVTGRGDQRYRERRPEVQGEETRGTGRGDQRYRERRLEVKREETREFNVDAPSGVVMEGYLFKRASNAFKTWNRRWFSIQNSQLVYQKKLKDSLTVVVEDLRLCSVKPCEDIERRFCFEVLSPTKSCMLQAESEKLRQAWILAVQASIASAYRESPDTYYIERLERTASPSTSSIDSASEPRERLVRGETILQRIQSLPGNGQCCDCGHGEPGWASINLGVLLCIECSGIHRSLGVQCSKVRSLTLDSWEPELLKLMCELGNSVINHIYEGSCQQMGLKKPLPSSSRQEKEAWIKAKYVEKKFLKQLGTTQVLVNGERKRERRWSVKKCRRHHSATTVPKARRRYRRELGSVSAATLSSAAAKFRRESLFCPDELDSLFSYFDTGSGPRSLSSDSGLGGSTDGSTDILVFGSVVDSVTEEEGEVSEDSSGEAELEPSDAEDARELHPGALLYRASRARNLPVMAEALAHGADVSAVSGEDEGKTALIQAVMG
ncbi:hypothetical protein NHX12_012862, partial [Muraenolepis orangiensis]